MQETQVRSLSWEDPLEKDMATHSSILAWRILWTEEPGGLQSMRSQRVGHDWASNMFLFSWCRAQFLVVGVPVVTAHGLSGCTSRALVGPVFLDQGSNKCPFHCKVDSYPLHHQGSPISTFFEEELHCTCGIRTWRTSPSDIFCHRLCSGWVTLSPFCLLSTVELKSWPVDILLYIKGLATQQGGNQPYCIFC